MPRPEQLPTVHATQRPDRGAVLALFPIAATVLFYCSPLAFRQHQLYQFLPQLFAYLALGLWGSLNPNCSQRLGLTLTLLPQGFRLGLGAGLLLGSINAWVILYLVPYFGGEYRFLAETPHAKIPMWIMLPWFIGLIAVIVELNFRGFLLGRLLALKFSPSMAVLTSSLLFAFDPFLVATFQQLHWIAVWDGLVWATLWVTFRNLYITIVAHAVEVMVLYGVMRTVLA
jgi:membrane protease YdiL (CAAX protease family)